MNPGIAAGARLRVPHVSSSGDLKLALFRALLVGLLLRGVFVGLLSALFVGLLLPALHDQMSP